MNHSETIGKLSEALAKAQGAFKPALKDSANPFFKSAYLSLSGAIEACRDALSVNGLAIVQALDGGERLYLVTTLLHSSGEWINSHYPVAPVKNDPQGIGSALTYARRYSLMAMVGIAAEDDDGEAATGRQAPNVPAKPPQPAKSPAKAIAEPVKVSIQDECKEWGLRLKADAGAAFANDVWKHSGETWELRLETLRDIVKATTALQTDVDPEQGRADISECIKRHTMDPTGLQAIRQELKRMANGKVIK